MVEDLAKKGQEGTTVTAPIIDLSPKSIKDAPKEASNTLIVAGIVALSMIGTIIARAGVDKLLHDKQAKDALAGKETKPINPDAIDGGLIATGIGIGTFTKNSYARAGAIGLSAGSIVNAVIRHYPKITQPFAKVVSISSPSIEW